MNDMDFDYASHIGNLSTQQRLIFYETLAFNLTIAIRSSWSNDTLSDAVKLHRIKWINEIMHRIMMKISVTRQDERKWTEHDVWEMIKGYVAQTPEIQGEIGNAILQSYSYAIRQTR